MMVFSIIDATGPIISAKISGELGKSEVTQIQTAVLDAIRRHGQPGEFLEESRHDVVRFRGRCGERI